MKGPILTCVAVTVAALWAGIIPTGALAQQAPDAPAPAPAPHPAPPPAYTVPPGPPPVPPPPPPPAYRAPDQLQRLRQELLQVEARFEYLRRERGRYSLAPPLSLVVPGVAGGAVSGWLSFALLVLTDDAHFSDAENRRRHRQGRAFAVLSGLCFGAALGGAIWAQNRVAARKRYGPELRYLKLRRRTLRRQLKLMGGLAYGGPQLSLRLSF